MKRKSGSNRQGLCRNERRSKGRRRKKGKQKAEWLSMAERKQECKNER